MRCISGPLPGQKQIRALKPLLHAFPSETSEHAGQTSQTTALDTAAQSQTCGPVGSPLAMTMTLSSCLPSWSCTRAAPSSGPRLLRAAQAPAGFEEPTLQAGAGLLRTLGDRGNTTGAWAVNGTVGISLCSGSCGFGKNLMLWRTKRRADPL